MPLYQRKTVAAFDRVHRVGEVGVGREHDHRSRFRAQDGRLGSPFGKEKIKREISPLIARVAAVMRRSEATGTQATGSFLALTTILLSSEWQL